MGKADQLAKRIFTEETPLATGHRVYFLVPPEVPVGALQPDGVLGLTAPPIELASLAPPWNRIRREVTADVKMPGDHSGRPALARCQFRRDARWVAYLEQDPPPEAPDPRDFGAWLVAPNFPGWLRRDEARGVLPIEVLGPGIWSLGAGSYETLWIAANELPLREDLLPFLIARSGRAFVEFAAWALTVKGPAWLTAVVKEWPMAQQMLDDFTPVDEDPEVQHRLKVALTRKLLSFYPEAANEVRKEVADEVRKEVADEVRKEVANEVRKETADEVSKQLHVRLFERKLKRALSASEQATLVARLETLGATRLDEVVIDLPASEILAWLADPHAT